MATPDQKLAALDRELASLELEVPERAATVSVRCGRPGGAAAYRRADGAEHYAASTIKLPLLIAAYRQHERGRLDLDQPVQVHDRVQSVISGSFTMDRGYDNDEEPWERLGAEVPLRWLTRRMIVSSSNLATNLVLAEVGYAAVAAVIENAGAVGVALRRPICDDAAADAGVHNVVTARGLAALLGSVARQQIAGAASCAGILEVLRAQEYRDEIPAGLPPGTVVANKNGWIERVRHDAALISPGDAPDYVLVVCTTGLEDSPAQEVIRRVATASWADRSWL